MNIQTEVLLDKLLAGPVYWLLTIATSPFRSTRRFITRKHVASSGSKVHSIAIAKYLGMGSIIQATPLMSTLRGNYPQATLYFVTSRTMKPFVERLHFANRVVAIDDRSPFRLLLSVLRLLTTLWMAHIDIFINLEIYSYFSSIVAAMSLSRQRLGYCRQSFFRSNGMYTQLLFFNTRAPISQIYLQMARSIGCKVTNSELSCPRPAHREIADLQAALPEFLGGKNPPPYIVINPNASMLRIERRWPCDRYQDLIRRLRKSLPHLAIVLSGAPDEVAYVRTLLDSLGDTQGVYRAAGKTYLGAFIALVDGAKLLITNDSGPMHLAFALHKPTVALFGPESPRHYGMSSNAVVLYGNVYCSPCTHEFVFPPCRGDNQCMKAISVEAVFDAVVDALQNRFSPPQTQDSLKYLDGDQRTPLGVLTR